MTSSPLVMLDTMVYSALFPIRNSTQVARVQPRTAKWRAQASGRTVTISFQTRAEVLYGAVSAKWDARRVDRLNRQLDDTPTLWVDEELVEIYADLRARCKSAGHALGGGPHNADLWIAASAVRAGCPLLTDDNVFQRAPLLQLLV